MIEELGFRRGTNEEEKKEERIRDLQEFMSLLLCLLPMSELARFSFKNRKWRRES